VTVDGKKEGVALEIEGMLLGLLGIVEKYAGFSDAKEEGIRDALNGALVFDGACEDDMWLLRLYILTSYTRTALSRKASCINNVISCKLLFT